MPNRPNFACVVRTTGDPFLVLPAIRTLVQSFDSTLPLAQVQTMEELIEQSLRPTRSSMMALAGFAGLALAMTGVGLFGVVTYVMSQRQREFAIRLTLGAQPRTLRRLVIGEGLRPVVIGLIAGVAGAVGLARFARSLLYGVSSLDPIAVAGATLLVLVVAAAACYAPVRRATRVDPMMLWRTE